jgi:phosphohistidine phosphatase SixA
MTSAAIYLVRHCHAQPRDGWSESDEDRPLTARGAKEAATIVSRFDLGQGQGVTSRPAVPLLEPAPTLLASSAAKRCLTTLQPLATACGLPVTTADFLAEGSHAPQVLEQLKGLATERNTIVACTHGDVIWAILELLSSDRVIRGGLLDVKKGSIWVLEIESGCIKSTRYIPSGKV